MGLLSASSLGQPIKLTTNVNEKSSPNVSLSDDMAPALTHDTSELRKRSLISQEETLTSSNIINNNNNKKLECVNSASASQGGNNSSTSDPEFPTRDSQINSDDNYADVFAEHNVDEILQHLVGSTTGEYSMLLGQELGQELDLLAGSDLLAGGSQENEPEVISPTPKVSVEESLREGTEREHMLQRRCDRLLRRLRKMQARGTGKHAGHQLQDLVTSARALLKARYASHRSHAASQQATKDQLLDTENVKNMSAQALVNLVRKINSGPPTAPGLAQALSPEQAAALRDGAGSLNFRLRHSEVAYDSDVTASSSGGESCDESVGYNPNHTGTLPICKRAAWRYARERASIVSRWHWLQANISDLEYRIRQYSECLRSMKAAKTPIRLLDPPISSKTLQIGTEGMVVNGCHSDVASVSTAVSTSYNSGADEYCARTRPLDLSVFKKRKIFTPSQSLPKSPRKIYSNQPPCCRDVTTPCIMCHDKRHFSSASLLNGRESYREKAARLDPGLHPLLSDMPDVSRSYHMAAQMRQPSWQQNQIRSRGLSKLGIGLKRTKPSNTSLPQTDAPPAKRKYTLHKRNSASALSAKLKRKAKNRKRMKRQQLAPVNDNSMDSSLDRNKNRKYRTSVSADGASEDSTDFVAPSPGYIASDVRATRRKREDSYDIDNIVIPYSMAASTRVEKLEYKEIVTPRWRVLEFPPITTPSSKKNGVVSFETDSEDINENAAHARHLPLEMEEIKKYRCPLKLGRHRNRRTDSRAESSGANTPDPLSPNNINNGDSPITSPRATPLHMLQQQPQDDINNKPPRRRTVSSQRASPEPIDVILYEPRKFPLTDNEYQVLLDDNLNKPGYVPTMNDATPPASPCGTDSTESADPEDDELDPEWTLDMDNSIPGSTNTKVTRR